MQDPASIFGQLDSLNLVETLTDFHTKAEKSVRIQTSSTKLLKFLVSDILDFSRMKQNKFCKAITEFNIKESVLEIIEIQQYQAEQTGITLTSKFLNLDHLNFLVKTDEQRVQQILLNLMSNAMKFTKRGEVSVVTELIWRQDIAKWAIQFHVKDSGTGIKKNDQGKLFRLFGTLQSTQQQNSQGIGLGLVICQGIVEMFGGRISFKSKWGKGSKFTYDFILEDQDLILARPDQLDVHNDSLDNIIENEDEIEDDDQEAQRRMREYQVMQFPPISPRLGGEVKFPRVLVVDDIIFNIDALKFLVGALGVDMETQIHHCTDGE